MCVLRFGIEWKTSDDVLRCEIDFGDSVMDANVLQDRMSPGNTTIS